MAPQAQIVTWFALYAVCQGVCVSVKLLSESMAATITDDDQIRIDAILAFWFKEQELSAPQIDRRMDIWFGEDDVFDLECKKEFTGEVEKRRRVNWITGRTNHAAGSR